MTAGQKTKIMTDIILCSAEVLGLYVDSPDDVLNRCRI